MIFYFFFHVNVQEATKKLTDYREESTFSFDPGKLTLVLLEKDHHQNDSRNKAAKKHKVLQERNQSQNDCHANDVRTVAHQGPLWALAKGEINKLEHEKPPPFKIQSVSNSDPERRVNVCDNKGKEKKI